MIPNGIFTDKRERSATRRPEAKGLTSVGVTISLPREAFMAYGAAMQIPTHVARVDWNTWVPTNRAVIVYLVVQGRVLLIHKKRGLGSGKVNAPGGHIEAGETPEQTAVREYREEVGLTPEDLVLRGKLRFQFLDGMRMEGFVFLAGGFRGTLTETPEAAPFWCPVDGIPLERMWEDDYYWLPQLLRGKAIDGRFVFDGDAMLSLKVTITDP
jgi:8-oxo-dGTP diphosphatase